MNKLSIFKIKKDAAKTKYYIFNIPFLKINFKKNRIKYYFLGILFFSQKKKYNKLNIKLNTKNFINCNIDNTTLLRELSCLPDFLYIPNPGNMGDMLIAAATMNFFDKNNIKYHTNPKRKEKYVVYGGGGVWTADYKKFWLKKLHFFTQAEKIIILPSSFNKCPEFIQNIDNRYVVFCREQQSFDYLTNSNTSAKIILDHDMALRADIDILTKDTLISQSEIRIIKNIASNLKNISATAKFLRQDCESSNNYQTDMDLSSYIHGNEQSSKDYIYFSAQVMLCVVDAFDCVITDRLHVGIASALMGKETYLLDNSYKKISNVYNNSLKHYKHIHLINEISDFKAKKQTANNNFNKLAEAIKDL